MANNDPDFTPDEVLKRLEAVASQYEAASAEYAAIELAAKALLFIHAEKHGSSFAKYLDTFDDELSEEQLRHLSALGLR